VSLVEYDEFGLFHENAAEYGLPYDGPPDVRRIGVEVAPGRRLSALQWHQAEPDLVLIHSGSQNAHTWDTVAMALIRPLVAVDLPGHGHSDGPGNGPTGDLDVEANAADVAVAIRQLAPQAAAVVGMSLAGLTAIALTGQAPELVRKLVLVDVLPGLKSSRARHITDFTSGPPNFANLDQLLERTLRFNPSRSVSSLRRGNGGMARAHAKNRHELAGGGAMAQCKGDRKLSRVGRILSPRNATTASEKASLRSPAIM
jgi:pimeloyl-ACP methyl ester carboxylesterase